MTTPARPASRCWIATERGFIGAAWFLARTPRAFDTAVLIVPGIAHEERTMSGGAAALAESLASAGLSSLVIELTGTSHSCGRLDADAIGERWRDDIRAAVEHTKRAGFARTVVVGVRLGALLALDALNDSQVDAFVAWSPIVSGRRHIRELKVLQSIGEVRVDPDADSIAVGGFDLPAPLLAHLSGLDLNHTPCVGLRRLLLVDSASRLKARWVDRLHQRGVNVQHRESTEVERWLFSASDAPTLPMADVGAITAWCAGLCDQGVAAVSHTRPAPVQSIVFDHRGRRIRETFVDIGPVGLSAVLSEPVDAPPEGIVRLLVSGVGPGRTFTDFARAEASRGRTSLRFDFSGFGTSPRRSPRSGQLYTDEGRDDVVDAVAHLRRIGHRQIALIGFCAGAWSMIQAGPLPGVVAAAAINVAFYRQPDPPEDGGEGALRSGIAAVMARLEGIRLVRRVGHRLDRTSRVKRQPIEWLEVFCEGGVEVLLAYAEEDPGLEYVTPQLRGGLRTHLDTGRLTLKTYPGLGHLVEGGRARSRMFDELAVFLSGIDHRMAASSTAAPTADNPFQR